jgi:5-methylcytosine-specific restriction endonuclease McrA
VRASTRKTPQPSPAALTDLPSAQLLTGTTQRLANLRRDCLIRDRHRCVISRSFDRDEARRRVTKDGAQAAQDDEGTLLSEEGNTFATLEVAHIIPHSLMTLSNGENDLVCSVPPVSILSLDLWICRQCQVVDLFLS